MQHKVFTLRFSHQPFKSYIARIFFSITETVLRWLGVAGAGLVIEVESYQPGSGEGGGGAGPG